MYMYIVRIAQYCILGANGIYIYIHMCVYNIVYIVCKYNIYDVLLCRTFSCTF